MSSDQTTLLALPFIAASQAQKHVTHNEALAMIDTLVQLSVLSETTVSPPVAPAEGDRYLVPAGASGSFSGAIGNIAVFQNGIWVFYQPKTGWVTFVADRQELRFFDGTAWQPLSSSITRLTKLGINADADIVNRLSVSSQASLLNHNGAGHQLKVNKATATDTASLLFQNSFSGRAEMGLAGSDTFSLKVSADGSIWRDAISVDRNSGIVSFAQGAVSLPTGQNLLINADFQINQRGFAGGSLAAGIFGFDRWKGAVTGATLNLSGLTATLQTGGISQVIEPALFGETTFAARSFTVSVANLSGGTLTIRFGNATSSLSASAPVTTLTTTTSDTGPLPFSLSVGSGMPSFSRLKLEPGLFATGWQGRPYVTEITLCQRYFESSVPYGQSPATYAPGPGGASIYASADSSGGSVTVLRYLTPKRSNPTVTIRDGAGVVGKISVYNGLWRNNFNFTGVLGATDKGFSLQQNNVGVYNVNFDFTAEAEL